MIPVEGIIRIFKKEEQNQIFLHFSGKKINFELDLLQEHYF